MASHELIAALQWVKATGLLLLFAFLGCTPVWGINPLQDSDAKASIESQQALLGSGRGVISLNTSSRLEGDVALAPGHDLRILAPLSVSKATVHLYGHNVVQCSAEITIENATDLFVSDGAQDITVRDCNVTVLGRSGGYLLTATRSARIHEVNNHLVDLAIFNTHNEGGPASRSTDVSLIGNSSEFTHEAGPIGIYLLYVLRGTVANNRFMGTGHGIQWWGGDGNVGWRGAEAVSEAGDLSITGNQCFSAGGACIWGSMGYNITVSGNTANRCSDVCFDSEGGVRNLFTGNVAQACGNGCYSVQMESQDVVFSGNFAYADAKGPALALVLIKHRNGNPSDHMNLVVTGNTFSCATLCTAFYSEGENGLDLSHNTISNGVIRFVNYTHSVRVAENSFHFTVALLEAALVGPSLAWGHTSLIERNTFLYEGGDVSPKTTCIAQGWSDNDATDEMRIAGNTCIGFGTGIDTETAGHNPGAPRANWYVQGNVIERTPATRSIVHRKTSGNETYTKQLMLQKKTSSNATKVRFQARLKFLKVSVERA